MRRLTVSASFLPPDNGDEFIYKSRIRRNEAGIAHRGYFHLNRGSARNGADLSNLDVRWLTRAQALVPRVQVASDEIEAARDLPPALVHAMAEAGLFRM